VVSAAVSVSGWVTAGLAAALAMGVRRAHGRRMEAVARACHELRGPLTAARLGLTAPGGPGEPPSPRRLKAIDTELGRAALALEDLAGTGAGRGRGKLWRLDAVEVRALVAEAVEVRQASAAGAGTVVRVGWSGEDAVVWGDRLRLAQAIGNLIANAIEHGEGPVNVSGAVRDGGVRIVVSDDGPGLPAPVSELIRLPRRGRGARGRGLAIAAEVARAHGGCLVSAPAKRGARLVLELPVRLHAQGFAG
jgi:signal transduction histidine kinase